MNKGAGYFMRQLDIRLVDNGLAESRRVPFKAFLDTDGQLVIGYVKVSFSPWLCLTDIYKAAAFAT